MGMERMAALLQGVDNIYEIDTMWRVLERAAELTEQRYGVDHRTDVALRVVTDHVRTSVMLVADGVIPANEGRGYVLRRLLRRSVQKLRLLSGAQRGGSGASRGGEDERFLHELASVAINALGRQYPELIRDAPNIHTVIDAEEGAFLGTLRTGSAIFDAAVEETRRRGGQTIRGGQAFQLHDTYGFPIDLTLEMASEQGLDVDEGEFRRLMSEQRQRAKADAAGKKTGNADISVFARALEEAGRVTFTGYDEVAGDATVVGLLVDGVSVPAAGAGSAVDVILDRTPFYAEGGGQLADNGVITAVGSGAADGARVDVTDVQVPLPGLIIHRGTVDRRRAARRHAGARADRRGAAPGHLPVAHGHPFGAPGVPRRAGGVGCAGRIGELARPLPVRLHRAGSGSGVGAAGGRGRGQPGPDQRPGGPGVPHLDRRSPRDGGARAVRGEVRR